MVYVPSTQQISGAIHLLNLLKLTDLTELIGLPKFTELSRLTRLTKLAGHTGSLDSPSLPDQSLSSTMSKYLQTRSLSTIIAYLTIRSATFSFTDTQALTFAGSVAILLFRKHVPRPGL